MSRVPLSSALVGAGWLALACGSSSGSGGVNGGAAGMEPDFNGGQAQGGSAHNQNVGGTSHAGDGGMTSGGAPPTEVLIQEITEKSIPTGTKVLLKGVYVTLNHSFAGTLWLQEPNGVTTPAHPYPEYSGIMLGTGFTSATQLGNIQIGDCVDVVSTVGWHGRNEYPDLKDFDTVTKRDASTCGPTPEPHTIDSDEAFAGIVATFDAITGGTSGPDAARYSGTLLSLESVKVRRPNETGFNAARQEGPEADSVIVLPPLSGTVSGLTEGQTLTRVVGVYNNYNKYMTFALQPRTSEEVVF